MESHGQNANHDVPSVYMRLVIHCLLKARKSRHAETGETDLTLKTSEESCLWEEAVQDLVPLLKVLICFLIPMYSQIINTHSSMLASIVLSYLCAFPHVEQGSPLPNRLGKRVGA